MLKRILLLWSVLSLLGLGFVGIKLYQFDQKMDPSAKGVYWSFAQKIWQNQSIVEDNTWRYPVEEGITAEDVEETMKVVANEHNLQVVAELPLYLQVAAMTGEKFRYIKIFMMCNALTAAKMLDHSDAFAANLPCRVTLIEDKTGRLWLYALNMDMMIYGGKPLPEGLKQEAIKVKTMIQDIMSRAASGDF